MSDNTGVWLQVLNNVPKEVVAVIMAMFISALRIIYDKEATRPVRVILEMLLCGSLSFTANYGLAAIGLSTDWSVFVGGCIGFVGSLTVRALSIKLLNQRLNCKGK